MYNNSSASSSAIQESEIIAILQKVYNKHINTDDDFQEEEQDQEENLEYTAYELLRELNDELTFPSEKHVKIEYNGISLLFLAAYASHHETLIKLLVAGGNALLKCDGGPNNGISAVDLISENNAYLAEMIKKDKPEHLSSNNDLNMGNPISFEKLMNDFFIAVNKPEKNLADIRKIRNICMTASNLLLYKNVTMHLEAEIKEIEKNIQSNPLAYYKYKNFLVCCVFYNQVFNNSAVYKNFIKNFNELHKFSNEAWIPDFSFLSITQPAQTTLGKGKPIFPLGLLLQMEKSYWLRDFNLGIPYFNTLEKKAAKLRLSDTGNLHFNDKELDDGTYMYIVTPKGGLIIQNIQEDNDEVDYHHSTFRGGQPVMSAGDIVIDKGKIISISNSSGHMRTPELNLLITVVYLREKNYLDDSCVIKIENPQLNISDKHSKLLDLTVLPKTDFTLGELIEQMDKVFLGDALNFVKSIPSLVTSTSSKKMKF